MLIKGIAVSGFGEDAADEENIRNTQGEYIIPGSSLKGVLRNRITYIARKLKGKFLLDNIFGSVGKGKDKGNCGHIIVKDTVVGNKENNENVPLQHRIHVDKFTGGVMTGGLFSEKNIVGDLKLEIMVSENPYTDEAAGLLLLALRDLSAGLFNIGSGYNIGKGYIDVETIKIIKGVKEAVIRIHENQIDDPSGMIPSVLAALSNATRKEK